MCSYKYGINKLHHDRLQYPDVHPLYTIYTKFHRYQGINENIQDGGHLGHFSSSYPNTRPLQMIRTKFHRNRSINKKFQYGGLLTMLDTAIRYRTNHTTSMPNIIEIGQ